MKALFVDHDERGTAEFRDYVATRFRGLAAAFAGSYDEAADHLLNRSFDILVMGVHEGGDAACRLSDLAEKERPVPARLAILDQPMLRDHLAAHLYVSRPIDGDKLRRAMIATERWRERLGTAELSELVAGSKKLPAVPEVFTEVRAEMASPDPSMARIGQIVGKDASLSVTILKLVNSALFGLKARVGNVTEAVTLLGMRTISNLVLAAGVIQQGTSLEQRYVSQVWNEAVQVGTLARSVAKDLGLGRSDLEDTQLAGLLHDIGEMVLFMNWPDDFLAVDLDRRDADERARFGATHADIGGYLCALWELPPLVVDAVSNHHQPSRSRHPEVASPATALHIARVIADGIEPGHPGFDVEHLEAVGVLSELDHWREQAA